MLIINSHDGFHALVESTVHDYSIPELSDFDRYFATVESTIMFLNKPPAQTGFVRRRGCSGAGRLRFICTKCTVEVLQTV